MNVLASIERMYLASIAPPRPAKNELIINEICLCFERLIPIASAAISSSRMALKARPNEELMRSNIIAIQIAAIIITSKIFAKPGILFKPNEPLVIVANCGEEIMARMISEKPRVAIAR